jgi:D-3-phosphoglycerate dehydrogenase
MIIGITDYVEPPYSPELDALPPGTEIVNFGTENEREFAEADLARIDGLLVWHAGITAHSLARMTKCRILVRYGVGYDNLDTDAVAARDIVFCNTPDYGVEEVADTAAAMILSLQRKLPHYDHSARGYRDDWQVHVAPPIARTRHCTLGVVGVGRIGTALTNRLRAFGYRLLGYDPYVPSGHEKAIGYERVANLTELLGQSDVVSIHCPLSEETRGMIGAAFVGAMKPGAILVNTARGGIFAGLNPLFDGLKTGHLSAIGFDVLPDEPPGDHPLIAAWRAREEWLSGRILISPHTAYYSEQAWYEMRFKAAETARHFLEDGRIRNRVC